MRAGRLVPDWLITFALERGLSDAMRTGFVLDGYPRTLEQAQTLMRSLGRVRLDRVIELVVPDDVVTLRLARRLREDDDDRVVCSRLQSYRSDAAPMLDFFGSVGLLERVDAGRSCEVIASDLLRLIDTTTVHRT